MKQKIMIIAAALSVFMTVSAFATNINTGSTGNKKFKAGWSKDQYKITYDLNGGALPSGKTNPGTYSVTTEAFTLNNPEKEGHTFLGWTGSNGNQAEKTVTITKGSTGDRSYKASYEINSYKLIFDANGGSGAPETKTLEFGQKYGNLGKPVAYEKENYVITFDGWYDSKTGGNKVDSECTIGAKDTTIYARWNEEKCLTSLVIKDDSDQITEVRIYSDNGTYEDKTGYDPEHRYYNIYSSDLSHISCAPGDRVEVYHDRNRYWAYLDSTNDTAHGLGTGGISSFVVPSDATGASKLVIQEGCKNVDEIELTDSTGWVKNVTPELRDNAILLNFTGPKAIKKLLKIRVFNPAGSYVDYIQDSYPEDELYKNIPVYAGCKIELYHEEQRGWMYETDDNSYELGENEVCAFRVPFRAEDSETLKMSVNGKNENFDLSGSTGWCKEIIPELQKNMDSKVYLSLIDDTKNIDKVEVSDTNGNKKTYTDYNHMMCYPGCEISLYHNEDKNWKNYTISGTPEKDAKKDKCIFTVPSDAKDNAWLYIHSTKNSGEITDNLYKDYSAGWIKNAKTQYEYELTLDANNGDEQSNQKKIVKNGDKYGSLFTPNPYSKEHYIVSFDGWWTEKSGGTQVNENTIMNMENCTIYAHWTETPPRIKILFAEGLTNLQIAKDGVNYETMKYGKSMYNSGNSQFYEVIPGVTKIKAISSRSDTTWLYVKYYDNKHWDECTDTLANTRTIVYTVPEEATGDMVYHIGWALKSYGMEETKDRDWNARSGSWPYKKENFVGI